MDGCDPVDLITSVGQVAAPVTTALIAALVFVRSWDRWPIFWSLLLLTASVQLVSRILWWPDAPQPWRALTVLVWAIACVAMATHLRRGLKPRRVG